MMKESEKGMVLGDWECYRMLAQFPFESLVPGCNH